MLQISTLRHWLVASWQSWDADWFVWAVFRSCEVSFQCEVRNYGFGLPGQSVPPHNDSDKLRNELHSLEQMPWETEAIHETQRWELERHITRVKSSNMYILAFFVFDLFYVMQEKRQEILLSFWNKVLHIFCQMLLCYYWNTADWWFDHTKTW